MKLSALFFGALLWLPVVSSAAATTQTPAPMVSLISHTVLDQSVIRLGDIFHGVTLNADRVVAYTPRPGSRATFDARWLRRLAAAYKLNWRPLSKRDKVVVERASRVLEQSELQELLLEQHMIDGGDDNTRAVLSNRSFRLHLPTDPNIQLTVENLTVNPTNGRFNSSLSWGTAAHERVRVTGRFERMTEIPVLTSRLMRGDLITKSNISWISMAESRLSRTAITASDRLIGMAAKRSIAPGKSVNENDVQRPVAVNRGQTVTIILVTDSMQLSTKGRALESGSLGDSIRISNLQTSTVIDAVITGLGRARVQTAVNLAMR